MRFYSLRARNFHLALGPLLAILVWVFVPLHASELKLLGVAAWIITWWILAPIPLGATALFSSAIIVFLGIADAKTSFQGFSHPLVFLFLGGFFVAKALTVHGLDRRLALFVLTRPIIGGRINRILCALMGITALLSMWLSNTSTTAIMLPITLGILRKINEISGLSAKNSSCALMISVAYSATIGGLLTPVGSPTNLVAIGMLERLASVKIGFLDWMLITSPIVIIALLALFAFSLFELRHLPKRIDTAFMNDELKKMGRLNRDELFVLLIFAGLVTLWILPSSSALLLGKTHNVAAWLKSNLPEPVSALFAACLLFALPRRSGGGLLAWKNAQEIDWNTLLLFGGGLSLGSMIFQTGLGQTIASTLFVPGTMPSLTTLLAPIVSFSLFFTETTSNMASANLLIPPIIALAAQAGLAPKLLVLGVAMACNMAFMLPVATPPNAIVFGTGLVPIGYMVRRGLIMNLFTGSLIFGYLLLIN